MLAEPILLGYLSLNKIYPGFQPDFNIVKHNFLVLETSNLSSELLKAFNEHVKIIVEENLQSKPSNYSMHLGLYLLTKTMCSFHLKKKSRF